MKLTTLVVLLLSSVTFRLSASSQFPLHNVTFLAPDGWKMNQSAKSSEVFLYTFSRGNDSLTFFIKPKVSFSLKDMFMSSATVLSEESVAAGPFLWKLMVTKYSVPSTLATIYVSGFSAEFRDSLYYGFAQSDTLDKARSLFSEFAYNLMVEPYSRSLTGDGYSGKKYYIGFGDYLDGSMENEVKYDIMHTHDIFTKKIGGDYMGVSFHGPSVSASELRSEWKSLAGKITKDDMFVQYSSGHGSHTGLAFGVSYDDIRDNALSYSAKEIIVFIMACYSGNLVSSFDKQKTIWQDWQNQGRTLFVLASSRPEESSETGPGTDPDQPGGPDGSAGSAFGHALWKALIGYSDGFTNGVKDGFISLGEIRDFSIWKTKQISSHTPVFTGVYATSLIMNQVPPKSYLDSLEDISEDMSLDDIRAHVKALDESFRVQAQRH